MDAILQRLGLPQSSWHGTPGTLAGPIVKRTQRIDVPVDKYPNVSTEYHYLIALSADCAALCECCRFGVESVDYAHNHSQAFFYSC